MKKEGLLEIDGVLGGGDESMRLHKNRGVLVTLDSINVFSSPSFNVLRAAGAMMTSKKFSAVFYFEAKLVN
jgi:hypothetical protein